MDSMLSTIVRHDIPFLMHYITVHVFMEVTTMAEYNTLLTLITETTLRSSTLQYRVYCG